MSPTCAARVSGEEPGFDLCLRMEPYFADFCAAGDELFQELGVGTGPIVDLGLAEPNG